MQVSPVTTLQVPNQQVPNLQVPNLQADGTRRWFAHDSAGRCGIIQIVCGFILFLTGIIMIPTHTALYFVGYGFWVPIFCWLSGGFGLHASKTKKTCPIVAALILSIFTAIMGFTVLALSCAGLAIDENYRECIGYEYDVYRCNIYAYYGCRCQNPFVNKAPSSVAQLDVRVVLHVINLLTGLCLIVVPFIQSCISCRAVCCRTGTSQPPSGNVMYVTQNTPHGIVYSQVPGAWQNNGQVQFMNTGGMHPVQQQFYPQMQQYGPPGTYYVPMQEFQPGVNQVPQYVPPGTYNVPMQGVQPRVNPGVAIAACGQPTGSVPHHPMAPSLDPSAPKPQPDRDDPDREERF